MGTIKTTNIETITGSGTLTLGQSGETISIPSGVTITNNGTQTGFGGTNTPMFEVGLSANQSYSSGVASKILFNTEVFDTNNCFASNKFTPTVAGKYYIYAQANFYTGSVNSISEATVFFYKNGSLYNPYSGTYRGNVLSTYPNNNLTELTPSINAIINMNGTTDYLEVYANAYSSTSGNILFPRTFFGGYKIIE